MCVCVCCVHMCIVCVYSVYVCVHCVYMCGVCGAFEKDNLIIGRYMISPVHQMPEYLHSLCGML